MSRATHQAEVLTELFGLLERTEASILDMVRVRRQLSAMRGDASDPALFNPWSEGEPRQWLETACAAAFWSALRDGDVISAKRIGEERNRRLDDDIAATEIAALDERAWQDAILFSRLIPDLAALGEDLHDRGVLGDELDQVIDRLIEAGPAAVADLPAVIEAVRDYVAEEWDTDETSWPPLEHVDDVGQVVAALRASMRTASREALVVRLDATDDSSFADISCALAQRPGYQGLFLARDRSIFYEGEPLLCARWLWRIDARPLLLEVCNPNVLSRSEQTARAQARAFIEEHGLAPSLDPTPIDAHPRGLNSLESHECERLDLPPDDTTLESLFGHERCRHAEALWILSGVGQTLHLQCSQCLRPSVAVVPIHQIAASDYPRYEGVIDSETSYLARERIRSLVCGEDIEDHPRTFADLRRHRPPLSLDPGDYAIAPEPLPFPHTRRRSLGDVLTERRRP